jgi:integrase
VKLMRLEGVTFKQAIDSFVEHLKEKGSQEVSVNNVSSWLRLFFADVMGTQVARLRPERAADLYVAFRQGRSVDYHRAALSRAKGLLAWCIDQGWCAENALAKVKGVGKKKKGKMQLTGDEVMKWIAVCLAKASRRDSLSSVRQSDAAVALMTLLLLALRQSDVLKRNVRDVDLGATVLRVTGGKTQKSNRPRHIPPLLRPFLLAITANRAGNELLFGPRTNDWLRTAQRKICQEAGVPYVCPHGLKGTMGSLMAERGEAIDRIANHLSHENPYVTERHYLAPGIIDGAQASRAIEVLFPVPNPVPSAHAIDAINGNN